jgi:hypothetical protein
LTRNLSKKKTNKCLQKQVLVPNVKRSATNLPPQVVMMILPVETMSKMSQLSSQEIMLRTFFNLSEEISQTWATKKMARRESLLW